jgi:hypothetical protein
VLEVSAALEEVLCGSGYVTEEDVQSVESRCKRCETCEEFGEVEPVSDNEERSDG